MLPLPRPRSGPGSTPPLAFWGEIASDRPSGGPGAPGRAPRPPVVTNSRVRWPTSRCRAHPRPGRGPGPAKRRSRKCAQHLSHGRACGKTRVRAVREWGSEGGSLALADPQESSKYLLAREVGEDDHEDDDDCEWIRRRVKMRESERAVPRTEIRPLRSIRARAPS